MRSHVMPLWERKCIVQELFVALSFSFAFAFALACCFAKTFGGSFLGALIGAFLGSFLGAFGGEFSFAFVFARYVERRAIGELTFAFTLGSTGWGADSVWKRREFGIVLLGGIVREGLLSGCAAAFGGEARTDLESGSGETRIAWPGVGRASWIRSCGSWQVDVETVIGEAIGLLGSVEGCFGFSDRLRLVLLVLGDELGA